MAVWVIVNVEEWDSDAADAAHGADAAGRRLADARHPELGLARIRQPRRLLALAQGVRRVHDPRRARDQRLGASRPIRRSCRPRSSANGSSSATASPSATCRRWRTSAPTSARRARSITKATGKPPRGWLGPGLTETWETPDLLDEEGYDYVADWVLDDQPVWLKTRSKPIVNMPYTQECNDVAMMLIQHHKASEYYDRALDQFEQIYADAADCARVMALVRASLHHGRAASAEIFPPRLRASSARSRRAVLDRRADRRLVSRHGAEGSVTFRSACPQLRSPDQATPRRGFCSSCSRWCGARAGR